MFSNENDSEGGQRGEDEVIKQKGKGTHGLGQQCGDCRGRGA